MTKKILYGICKGCYRCMWVLFFAAMSVYSAFVTCVGVATLSIGMFFLGLIGLGVGVLAMVESVQGMRNRSRQAKESNANSVK